MLSSVGVSALAGHEVQEGIEMHVAGRVGVHNGANALEVQLSLAILADGVAQRHEARFELLGGQAAGAVLVKVVEAGSELVQLLLCDSLRVAGQDLVFGLKN